MLIVSAGVGVLVWLFWWITESPGLTTALLLSGPLVAVPLGLFADQGVQTSWKRAASWLQLPAALLLMLAVMYPSGLEGTLAALPWVLVTFLLGAHGLARLLPRARHTAAELCIDAAYLFVVVGGVWTLLDRLGARPLGYDSLIVQLTAIHFHVAGFVLPLLAGLLGRSRPGGIPSLVTAGIVGGIPLVAGGLVLSQLTGNTNGEWVASWTLAIAGGAVALLQIQEAQSREDGARYLLGFSGASLLVGMFLAAAYGLGRAQSASWPGIADMIVFHGVTNAIGFALFGLAARALAPPEASQAHPCPPGRGMWSRGFVGNGWFLETERADPRLPTPAGQIEHLSDLDGPAFSAAQVSSEVVRFYEQTCHYELWVRPRWSRPFALPGRLFVALARRMGQLVLPTTPNTWAQIRVRTFGADQRLRIPGVRLYERRYADDTPMFIAAYGLHTGSSQSYMSVTLPLPGTCLMGVLHAENMGDGGLRLRSTPDASGEAGLFLDTPIAPMRLPLHEDLVIGPLEGGFAPGPSESVAGATIGATHRFTFAGITCLELEYLIRPTEAA